MSHILVIDDQQQIREIIKEFLEMDGHTVDEAENGIAGLKKLGLSTYDLVITDILMPEQDGIGIIVELRKMHSTVRIIAMSGGAGRLVAEELLNTARLLGAVAVLRKPLDFEMLRTVVNKVLQ